IDPKQYFVKYLHQKVVFKYFSQCLRIPKKPLSKSPSMAQPTGIAGTINLKSKWSLRTYGIMLILKWTNPYSGSHGCRWLAHIKDKSTGDRTPEIARTLNVVKPSTVVKQPKRMTMIKI